MGQSPPGEPQPGLVGCPHRWKAGSSLPPGHCLAWACCPHRLHDGCPRPSAVSWACSRQCASRCSPVTRGWKAWNCQGLVVRAAALPSSHPAAASLVVLRPGQVSSGRNGNTDISNQSLLWKEARPNHLTPDLYSQRPQHTASSGTRLFFSLENLWHEQARWGSYLPLRDRLARKIPRWEVPELLVFLLDLDATHCLHPHMTTEIHSIPSWNSYSNKAYLTLPRGTC